LRGVSPDIFVEKDIGIEIRGVSPDIFVTSFILSRDIATFGLADYG
jgi:hypothetical protein